MKENNSLSEFNWDAEDVFFGTPAGQSIASTTDSDTDSDIDVDIDTSKETTSNEEDLDTPAEDVDTFFGEASTEGEGTNDLDAVDTNDNGDKYWNDVYADFKENGLFNHTELEDGEILTSDRLIELQETEYETEVSERLKTWAETMDEDAKAFIKFKSGGGSTKEFFDTYQNSSALPTGEIEDEKYQDKVIRYQLAQEGWDSDEIEDRLEYLTTSKKKEAVATRYTKKLSSSTEKQKEVLLAKLEQEKIAIKKEEDTFKNTIRTTLGETKDIKGFKITPKDQDNIYSLLTRKQYKTQGGKSITGFQKKIGEAFQDPQKMILLAKLIDSDFDVTGFEKKATTVSTQKIKSRLEQRRGSGAFGSATSTSEGSLADLFN